MKHAAASIVALSLAASAHGQTFRAPTPHITGIVTAVPVIVAAPLNAFSPNQYSSLLSLVPAAVLTPVIPSVAVHPLTIAALSAAAASEFDPVEPAKAPAPEQAAAAGGALFDGSAAAPVIPPAAPPAAPLGSGLRMARSEHEPWLTSVVELLADTRTGRRVLRDIDALALRRGVPVLIDVKSIGNNGEFRYDSNLLIMDYGHLKRDPYQSAPIFAHELQHVLQRALELPVDALELEIESYTVESRVWTELGVEPDAGTFSRDARLQLKKGLPGFVKWLGGKYKNNIPLYDSSMDAYIARLENNLAAALRGEAKIRRKIVALERVISSMKKNGMSEGAIAAHRREDIEPLERRLRDGAVNRAWIERDLLRLKEPAIRAAFRSYARGVARRARSLSRP